MYKTTESDVSPHTTPTKTPTASGERQPPTTPKEEMSPAPPRSWQLLRTKLREHPFDPDAWNTLVESGGDMEQIRDTYESLLKVYPNTVCPLPLLFPFPTAVIQMSLVSVRLRSLI
jgi:hypothetical protein